MKNTIVAIVATLTLSMPVMAKPIPVGTGGETGNYYGMTEDIKSYCELSSGNELVINTTSGSIENMDGMTSKKYKVGWVQEDVLQFNAKNSPRKVNEKRMKVILAAMGETFHLMSPVGWKPTSTTKKKFWESWGFGNSEPMQAVDLSSLANQTVGGWGGSLTSLHALNHFAALNMNIVEIPENERAAPKIPVLLVGGQPYNPAQKMLESGKYTMLPVVSKTLADRAPFFTPTKASYVVNGKQVNIPTFQVRALLMGKSSRKEERNADMVELAACIQESLPDLADDSDTNPNWETVYELNEDEDNEVDWKYFN